MANEAASDARVTQLAIDFADQMNIRNPPVGGATGQILVKTSDADFGFGWSYSPGTGDVVGPTSATDGATVLFDGLSGKLVKDGPVLGSIASQSASAVAITGGSVTGITDLTIADGGTGASTAADARTNLGLGTAATQDTGTSGATIPLLNADLTFSGAVVFSGPSTALGGTTPQMSFPMWTDATKTAVVSYAGGEWGAYSSVVGDLAFAFGIGTDGYLRLKGSGGNTFTVTTAAANRASFSGPVSATGDVTASTYLKSQSTTVSALPAAATAGAGARYFVTDATAVTFLSTVAGGGSNRVPVVSDGTNWKIG